MERVLSVLMLAVARGEAEAVSKLLCSPHLGLDRVYSSPDMAQRYTSALAAARRPHMPSSVTVSGTHPLGHTHWDTPTGTRTPD